MPYTIKVDEEEADRLMVEILKNTLDTLYQADGYDGTDHWGGTWEDDEELVDAARLLIEYYGANGTDFFTPKMSYKTLG